MDTACFLTTKGTGSSFLNGAGTHSNLLWVFEDHNIEAQVGAIRQ
jgi:hypothetical protein